MKNGFAVSGILYPMLILFLCFILLIMGNLAESHYRLRRLTSDIMLEVNGEDAKSLFKRKVEDFVQAGRACTNYGISNGKISPTFAYSGDTSGLNGRFYTMADGRTAALIDDGEYCAYKLTNFQNLRVQESGTCETSVLSHDCSGAGLICPNSSGINIRVERTKPVVNGENGELVAISNYDLPSTYPYAITPDEPTEKEEGTIWIQLDFSSTNYVSFAHLKLPVSDAKQYVNGEWKTCLLYLYQDGWKLLTKIEYVYDYTGGSQTLKVPYSGSYLLEVWGAQGGNENEEYHGGYGGYSRGKINLNKGTTLYLYVGGVGERANTSPTQGGFNGGGNGVGGSSSNVATYTTGGGGATHIALVSGNLSSLNNQIDQILIVAGGGGGSSWWQLSNNTPYTGIGGSGGGFKGGTGTTTYSGYPGGIGGTQTSGSSFGMGASGSTSQPNRSGGGGGFYGGSTGYYSTSGGGSGYIGNSLLSNKLMYCYNCEESTEVNTQTISTTNVSENPIGNYAKKGNGYVKVTFIG